MDIFCEYMVKHKKTMKDNLIITGFVVLALFLTLLLVVTMLFFQPKIGGILLLLLVGIWYGAVMMIKRRNIEFEYILTNETLDIDKIMARSARKRVISINCRSAEVCAPANDVNFKHLLENSNAERKVLDCSGDISEENVYFIDFEKEAQKYRVFFQPSQKIINGIKHANPRNVTVRSEDIQ